MRKIFLLAVLLLAISANTQYFLSPSYPPSAYQNQYYTTKFRVRGLQNPTFTFQGLPKDIKGSSDGILSGIPTQSGSFSLKIKYSEGSKSGSNEVILKVQADNRKTQNTTSAIQVNNGIVVESTSQLIFFAGSPVNINLNAKNAQGATVWVFNELPNGLKGDSSKGTIQGLINTPGHYSFNVECGDSLGKSGQVYLTINVQPKTTLTTTKIVDVPSNFNLNTVIPFDLIEKEQVAADNQLFASLDIVNTRKAIVADVKGHVAIATLKVNNAQAAFDAADAKYKQLLADNQDNGKGLKDAQKLLQTAQKNLQLALTEQNAAANAVAQARRNVDAAQKRFDDAHKAYKNASEAADKAKKDLDNAEQALRDARTKLISATEEYKKALTALEQAKNLLQAAKVRKQKADQGVKLAQDSLQLANLAKDTAQANLKAADFNLDQANQQLANAIKIASLIRQKVNEAQKNYNSDKWDLQIAMNKLYVAQARKQAADRASAIALAQGSYSDHNSKNGFNVIGNSGSNVSSFGGCDSRSYPQITGSAQVVSVKTNGYSLSSGHQVVYGACSTATKCNVGDFVQYNGYFANGVVNALSVKKLSAI